MNHPGPTKAMLFGVWAALMVLLLATWGVAYLPWGSWNIVVAMTIAVGKALLVILIFMHVRYAARLTWIFVAAGFFWLFLMVALTLSDYLTRGG